MKRKSTGRPRSSLRSEEHTSELQSRLHLVCRLLLEKKKKTRSYVPFLYDFQNTSPVVLNDLLFVQSIIYTTHPRRHLTRSLSVVSISSSDAYTSPLLRRSCCLLLSVHHHRPLTASLCAHPTQH